MRPAPPCQELDVASLLIADDEEGLRAFLAAALETEGHEIALAADGTAALAELSRRSFDLVITDLKMPGADGMAVLQQVRAEHQGTQVIVLTAHGSVASA